MRLVLIGPAYPLRGGIANFSALLNQKLIEKGHEVSVLSFYRQYPNFLFPGKTQLDAGKNLAPVKSHPLLDSINPFSWVRAFFWIRKQKPQFLVFNYWMPFFAPCYTTLILLSKLFLRIPCIYVCHNITPHEQHMLNQMLSWLGLLLVDGFIVQCKSVEDDLLSKKKNPKYVLAHHPIYEIFPEGIPQKEARKQLGIQREKVILYFGIIRKYKGLKYLVEAMPAILQSEDVHLIICGEFYEGREEIVEFIEQNNLSDHILFADTYIPNEAVHTYFCAADLVTLPYLSATQSGIVQMAYYYNKPVLATDVGGLPEVVLHQKTGFIVPPANHKKIAEAITQFYQENLESEFTKNVQQEKEKYSWDRMTEAVETLYQQIGKTK